MPKHNTCPYFKCPLGCRSKVHHRARYAALRQRIVRKKNLPSKRSTKINYEALAKFGLV